MDVQRRVNRETLTGLQNMPLHINFPAAGQTINLQIGDQVVIANTGDVDADATAILILPSVAEAVGKFYYIEVPVGAAGGDVTVMEKETGAVLTTYGDMDADGDHMLLFSTGTTWRVILDGVA